MTTTYQQVYFCALKTKTKATHIKTILGIQIPRNGLKSALVVNVVENFMAAKYTVKETH